MRIKWPESKAKSSCFKGTGLVLWFVVPFYPHTHTNTTQHNSQPPPISFLFCLHFRPPSNLKKKKSSVFFFSYLLLIYKIKHIHKTKNLSLSLSLSEAPHAFNQSPYATTKTGERNLAGSWPEFQSFLRTNIWISGFEKKKMFPFKREIG